MTKFDLLMFKYSLFVTVDFDYCLIVYNHNSHYIYQF